MIRNDKSDSMTQSDGSTDPTPINELVKIINLLADFYEDEGFGSREDVVNLFKCMRQCPEDCTNFFREELAEKESAMLDGVPTSHISEIQFALLDLALAHCVESTRPGLNANQQWWQVCRKRPAAPPMIA